MPKFFVTVTLTVENVTSPGAAVHAVDHALRPHDSERVLPSSPAISFERIDAVYVEAVGRVVVDRGQYECSTPGCSRPAYKLGDKCAVCVPP